LQATERFPHFAYHLGVDRVGFIAVQLDDHKIVAGYEAQGIHSMQGPELKKVSGEVWRRPPV
jgi:hypothetical protein